MTELSPHQRLLLLAIRRFQWKCRRSPSLRELCLATGVSSNNGVRKMLLRLVAHGHVELALNGTILFPRESLNADYFRQFQ